MIAYNSYITVFDKDTNDIVTLDIGTFSSINLAKRAIYRKTCTIEYKEKEEKDRRVILRNDRYIYTLGYNETAINTRDSDYYLYGYVYKEVEDNITDYISDKRRDHVLEKISEDILCDIDSLINVGYIEDCINRELNNW